MRVHIPCGHLGEQTIVKGFMPSADQPRKAETLDHFWKSLLHEPLHDAEELAAFYCQEVNAVRGEDRLPGLETEVVPGPRWAPFSRIPCGAQRLWQKHRVSPFFASCQ